jgi:hypothetical protein
MDSARAKIHPFRFRKINSNSLLADFFAPAREPPGIPTGRDGPKHLMSESGFTEFTKKQHSGHPA